MGLGQKWWKRWDPPLLKNLQQFFSEQVRLSGQKVNHLFGPEQRWRQWKISPKCQITPTGPAGALL
jgi:hypothetical protein